METFNIAIKSLDDACREFEETYEALRRGKPAEKHQGVYFTSLDAVRRILTQERLALLHAIRERGPASIYALAQSVGRDLKNVQDDLELLHKQGLVRFRRRVSDQRGAKIPEVPFHEIELTIALDNRQTCAMDFIQKNLQRFLAEVGITQSAVRGERKPGLKKAVIDFLSNELQLSDFTKPGQFSDVLDRETNRLIDFWSRRDSRGMSWGTARKCLNILLREATYNYYMRARYGLEAVESLLEVSLDNRVEKNIRRDMQRLKQPLLRLPKFESGFSIIKLTREQHENYQTAAEWIAREAYHTHRVHLDLVYFPKPRLTGSRQISAHAATEPAAGK
jgi:predicted transcriptional regulator